MKLSKTAILGFSLLWNVFVFADIEVGKEAPLFKAKNQDGVEFTLSQNRGKIWSVLYFYHKADTPGCTAQACAFRDAIKVIEQNNAKLYGISTNSVSELQAFKEKHKLNFDLLSDEKGEICSAYGTKMPLVTYSKRHTFIVDPKGIVRYIDREVDPAQDAPKVAEALKKLEESAFVTVLGSYQKKY